MILDERNGIAIAAIYGSRFISINKNHGANHVIMTFTNLAPPVLQILTVRLNTKLSIKTLAENFPGSLVVVNFSFTLPMSC
jgi:hypothetical protein